MTNKIIDYNIWCVTYIKTNNRCVNRMWTKRKQYADILNDKQFNSRDNRERLGSSSRIRTPPKKQYSTGDFEIWRVNENRERARLPVDGGARAPMAYGERQNVFWLPRFSTRRARNSNHRHVRVRTAYWRRRARVCFRLSRTHTHATVLTSKHRCNGKNDLTFSGFRANGFSRTTRPYWCGSGLEWREVSSGRRSIRKWRERVGAQTRI